jgi:hypothetical protein
MVLKHGICFPLPHTHKVSCWNNGSYLRYSAEKFYYTKITKVNNSNIRKFLKGPLHVLVNWQNWKKLFQIRTFSFELWYLWGNSNTEHLPCSKIAMICIIWRFKNLIIIKRCNVKRLNWINLESSVVVVIFCETTRIAYMKYKLYFSLYK